MVQAIYCLLSTSKVLAQTIDQAMILIHKYRSTFISEEANQDQGSMIQVRSLVNLLSTCSGPDGSASLYKQYFEPKFVTKTQQFYEK